MNRARLRRLCLPSACASGRGGISTTATATCFPTQDWVIGTSSGGGAFSYLDDGTADGSGGVAASWENKLNPGTKVRLMCENAKGWTQDMTATAP